MSCQTKCLPFGTGTLWKLLADSVYRGVLATPLKLCGDGMCVLKQLFTTALRALRGYSAALLGDHVPNGWEVFTHEPNRYAQALAEIAHRWDGSLTEGGFCRSFQIRSVLRHVISAPSRK